MLWHQLHCVTLDKPLVMPTPIGVSFNYLQSWTHIFRTCEYLNTMNSHLTQYWKMSNFTVQNSLTIILCNVFLYQLRNYHWKILVHSLQECISLPFLTSNSSVLPPIYKMEATLERRDKAAEWFTAALHKETWDISSFSAHEKEMQCKQLWFTSTGMQAENTVSCGSNCLIVTSRWTLNIITDKHMARIYEFMQPLARLLHCFELLNSSHILILGSCVVTTHL